MAIEADCGVVHIYYDAKGQRELALAIINESKTRCVSANYALDCLLVHKARLFELSIIFNPLADAQITVYADERAMQALHGRYPVDLLKPADEKSYGTKFSNNELAVKTVDTIEEALEHISRYSSNQSEAIISESATHVELFTNRVKSAIVYVNTSTLFCDDDVIDLKTETEKLHARFSIELVSCKWVIRENYVSKIRN